MDAEHPEVSIGRVLTLRRGLTGQGDSPATRGQESVWSLVGQLTSEGLDASTSIWLGPDGVEQSLADFFGEMAEQWRGWEGTKEWIGMEGGLDLRCTYSVPGTVAVHIVLRHLSGSGWTVEADGVIDAGEEMTATAKQLSLLLTLE